MSVSAEEAYNIIQNIALTHHIEKVIETIEHRRDYADYRVTLVPQDFVQPEDESDLEGKYLCEIRERLIEILAQNPKHGDSVREVAFKLKNAIEYTIFD